MSQMLQPVKAAISRDSLTSRPLSRCEGIPTSEKTKTDLPCLGCFSRVEHFCYRSSKRLREPPQDRVDIPGCLIGFTLYHSTWFPFFRHLVGRLPQYWHSGGAWQFSTGVVAKFAICDGFIKYSSRRKCCR